MVKKCPKCDDIDFVMYYGKGWEEKGYCCLKCGYTEKISEKRSFDDKKCGDYFMIVGYDKEEI